ncbi:penicillin-binding protein 1A [Qingshengfaniella alkalisoli]|uniref:Penicillin-binding protein 1A n=1 Tax=Qingshengfaniella alkalisoli TaxID=2599296 RepID=A0A5B8I8A8_9RHOB|nr:penicillin-binding protein 1A [Qingshengfaniella alkalisoli]QDY68876.1 penicillin-binding protein 1A [Qingshengfaniella alkalisoli]
MLRFILGFFGAIFSFVTIGAVLAGLIVGAIFWMYGRDLPDHDQLSQYAPPTISRVYSAEGELIDEFAQERRLFVPSSEIPDLVKQAFISAEDKNFYTHHGYDTLGMVKAAIDMAQGGALRGASTITQQVMKNFLLSGDRSAERKIKELILAARLEETLSKDQILELYLNEIYLGQNSYGVAAAAQTYFNKKLSDLDAEEAAYLAALPKAPSTYHPVREMDRAVARRNFVLREMNENGYLDDESYEVARAAPLKSVQNGDYDSFRRSVPPRDYFTDEIRRQLSQDFGETEFFTGGLSIRSTFDPDLQGRAAESLRHGLEQYDRSRGIWRGTGATIATDTLGDEGLWRAALAETDVPRDITGWYPAVVLSTEDSTAQLGIEGLDRDAETQFIPANDVTWARRAGQNRAQVPADLVSAGDVVLVRQMTDDAGNPTRWSLRQVPEVQGAFMAMDVNSGRVLAMQGGFSYQSSVFNRATQATRQPGSSFKPFVYAAALDSGYTPATIVIDAPIEVNIGGTIWRPKNYSNKFYGPTPLRTGIERSRNLMTVRLAQAVGMDTVADYAERFGVYDDMGPYLANSLGSEETTLWRMVAAYSMFANGGERVQPTLVDRVQDRWGKTIYRHEARRCTDCEKLNLPRGEAPHIDSDREQVMDPITAYQLTSMMKGVVDRGTASGRVNLPVPTAGKTGTTNDEKDVWFVGFTSNIAAGCYIGYDQPRPLGRGAAGGSMCGPVFNEFMKYAVEIFGGGPFKVPPGGHFIKIDRISGARLADSATGPNVVAEYFRDGVTPVFGAAAMVDGGFAMGSELPLYSRSEALRAAEEIITSTGERRSIPRKATFGAISSGGLY